MSNICSSGGGKILARMAGPAAAPPPSDIYEHWLASQRKRTGSWKNPVHGRTLRRAIVMLREGHTVGETENILGVRIKYWISKLPPELAA